MKKSWVTQMNEYLHDNPERYWFKRKVYGWGWIPVTAEGWIVVGLFIIHLILFAVDLEATGDIKEFYLKLGLAISLLILICYKTGEKPRWSWGFTKKG